MQNGHGRESGGCVEEIVVIYGCVEVGFSTDNCSVQLSGDTSAVYRIRSSAY